MTPALIAQRIDEIRRLLLAHDERLARIEAFIVTIRDNPTALLNAAQTTTKH